jgi:hypothetical protein
MKRKVHPAIDVVDDHAYVGVWFECEVTRKGEVSVEVLPFLVRDDGKIILYHDGVLKDYGLRRAYQPVYQPNKWTGEIVEINQKEVYMEVRKLFEKYIDFQDPKEYDLVTLWTIGTYFYHMFDAYPYLFIGGEKRVGKSRTLKLIQSLAFNAIMSHNMSISTLFRLVQNARSTLLIDEQEKLSSQDRATEFRTLLLGGYKKGSLVYRIEKTKDERMIPVGFEIYSPKAMANISGLEDVLEDRTIDIVLIRSTNPNIVNTPDPDPYSPEWIPVRNRLTSLFLKKWREVKKIYEVLSGSQLPVTARARELWLPILSLAKFFENEGVENLYEKMVELSQGYVSERAVEDVLTPEGFLIQTLLEIVTEDGWYYVKDIAAKFEEKEPPLKKVNAKIVGTLLSKRLRFKNKQVHNGKVRYFISRSRVEQLARIHNITEEKMSEGQVKQMVLAYIEKNQPVEDWKVIEMLKEKGYSPDEAVKIIAGLEGVVMEKSKDGYILKLEWFKPG